VTHQARLEVTPRLRGQRQKRKLRVHLSFYQHRPCRQRKWAISQARVSQYSSTHCDESPSDEEEGLRLESEENWEMISIRGIHYTVSRSEQALNAPISHVVKGQPFPGQPRVAYPPSCRISAAVSTFPHLVNTACVRQPSITAVEPQPVSRPQHRTHFDHLDLSATECELPAPTSNPNVVITTGLSRQ